MLHGTNLVCLEHMTTQHSDLLFPSWRWISWRWWAAAILFLLGFCGLLAGVGVSERPGVADSTPLTKAYYTLGLFVVGGLDIGTPQGGPWLARTALWVAYFGAPLLTASAVIEALIKVISPGRWLLRRLTNHIIIFGSGRLTLSYLRLLQRTSPHIKVVVVDEDFDLVREQELRQKFNATTLVGDLTHRYLLRNLRLNKARRVLLLGDNDFQAFEAATRILQISPRLEGKVILHCHNLRFMRSVQNTNLAARCEIFNTYNMAATGLVHAHLIEHFAKTASRDTVVMAGFGRFGQSVLEELHTHAADEIASVAVIDADADRRVLVVDEQARIGAGYQRLVFEGDIAHPNVWYRLTRAVDLSQGRPTIILGTGQEQNNLRTALWIKHKYPNAKVFARTNDFSEFALTIGNDHDITSISMTQLVEENVPLDWLA